MKAKILPGQLMSKQVKDNYQRYVNRLAETQNKTNVNRLLKIAFVALYQELGLDKDSLLKFHCAFQNLLAEAAKDELYWWHIDQVVCDEIGIAFQKESLESYDRFEKEHQRIANDISRAIQKAIIPLSDSKFKKQVFHDELVLRNLYVFCQPKEIMR